MQLSFAQPSILVDGTLVVGCPEDGALAGLAAKADEAAGGALASAQSG